MPNLFEQTISAQNPHWSGMAYAHSFKRSHEALSLSNLELEEIQVVTGIRRSGKSTLLQTAINQLLKKTDPKSILYINFDDPKYTEVCSDAGAIYSIVTAAETMTRQPIHYLFLDEVQNVEAWETYVKSVYDMKRFKKIFVTGSNSHLLNSDYAKLLSGRYLKTHIYPIAFHELLQNSGITEYHQLIKEKPTALAQVNQLLNYGGFPRIHCVNKDEQRIELLKSYYETILLKDCMANNAVRDTKTLMNLAHYLMTNPTVLYSYNSLSKAVSSNENTIQQFIHIFQNAYLINELKSFSYSVGEQLRAKKKVYCVDNGLITATAFTFTDNYGKLFENLVHSELQKTGNSEIYFYNDQKECDFILHNPNNPIAIQACYQLTPENRTREIAGLIAAMEKLKLPKGVIITYDDEEKISDNMDVIPFWKYFSLL